MNEASTSTSGHAARYDYWRDWLDDTIRIRNRAMMVEAAYENPNFQIGALDAGRIGKLDEIKLYLLAANEHEYLMMVSEYIQMVRTHENPEELGGMPTQKGKEPVKNLLKRHRGITDSFRNIVLHFIERQPITMMSRRQLSLRLHVFRASLLLASSLDKLTQILESRPNMLNRPLENILEENYEAKIQVFLENFSKHGKNICDCPHDVHPGCSNEDQTHTSLADEFRAIFHAFSEVSNIKPPYWYKDQGSTSKQAQE